MHKAKITYRKFNPNYYHLLHGLRNNDLRFIFMQGGSSSGKTNSLVHAVLIECLTKGFNTKVYRKVGSSIKDSIYNSFKSGIDQLRLSKSFTCIENKITCFNGSYITFSGLDNPEKIKGLESYQYIVCEEISEFDHSDIKQIKKRLRGREGQKIIGLFNPISEEHWIKKEIFDKEELNEIDNHLYGKVKDPHSGEVLPPEYSMVTAKWLNSSRHVYNPREKKEELYNPDLLIIKSTYLDNFWVVGSPDGSYGFYDRQTVADFYKDKDRDLNYYNIYALGDWGTIKTGGEFWGFFEPSRHKGKFQYIKGLPIHISVDNNVLPYISVTFWQIKEEDGIYQLRQFHELTAEDPFNTASKASVMVSDYLKELNYRDVLFLYGDSSTKSANTIDDEKRSFLDKFKEVIESNFVIEERIPRSNPSVAMTGEFINNIYSGTFKTISIGINETCRRSIEDYTCTKKDVNGAILKQKVKDKVTGQSYEKYGHLSDTKRYFITEAFKDIYIKFSNKRKHNQAKEEDMKYYDRDKVKPSGECFVEVHPAINGMFVAVMAFQLNSKVYIDKVIIQNHPMEYGALKEFCGNDSSVQFEVPKSMAYYIKEFRDIYDGDVRGRFEKAHREIKIQAHLPVIKENFLFPDMDESIEEFMQNILDFKDKESIEAMYVLSCISDRIKRNN